jgi:uncharacterized membrane protein YdjX (TVP38/TMEM64 family)
MRDVAVGFALLVATVALVAWLEVDLGTAGASIHDATLRAADYMRAWGMMAVVVSIALMIIHGVAPFPAEVVVMANCMVFGPYWGFAVSWVGAMLAAIVAFGLSRRLGRPFLRRLLPARNYAKVNQWAGRQGTPTLILCRLIPLVSFNAVNYGAGLMSISWWTFIWTTAIGIVPGAVATILVTESVLDGNVAIALLTVSAVVLMVVFWMWRTARRP